LVELEHEKYLKVLISGVNRGMVTSKPVPLVRRELLAAGFRSGTIQNLVRSGHWERPHRGVYLESSLIGESREQVVVQAHLVAAGANAVLSHHSAAAVHGFDSTGARPPGCWITIPDTRRVAKAQDVHITRSRHLGEEEVELIRGVPVTSRSRTVLDLATLIDQQELERVVESAIRGEDPKHPDRYRRNVEQALTAFANGDHRRPGAAALQRCLAIRSVGARPTGSIAETSMLQGLRRAGVLGVICQPTLRIVADDGTWTEIFPDQFVFRRRLILEVDGEKEHRERFRADIARQNKFLVGFNLIRCTGADALFEADRIAQEVARYPIVERDSGPFRWESGGRVVSGSGLSWTLGPR
jgi:hypothetical protein